jgi:hypothetical protein
MNCSAALAQASFRRFASPMAMSRGEDGVGSRFLVREKAERTIAEVERFET